MEKVKRRVKGWQILTAPMESVLDARWAQYLDACSSNEIEPVSHPELRRLMRRVWAYSDFVSETTVAHPDQFAQLCASGDLFAEKLLPHYRADLAGIVGPLNDEPSLARELRRYRRREMLRIAWRDLAGWADLRETLHSLTGLADACVQIALDKLYGWEVRDSGVPAGGTARRPALIVIGMGKLGAHELNFSSDIDLIFAYPEEGETKGAREIDNETFFTRLGQRLIGLLDRSTVDGAVFRVDMRLRPYGDSGPLAMSFTAMEHYYQLHGRDWERYAFVKARCIAGDEAAGNKLMTALKPFVFRRYLDFGAFEALRDMKAMIAEQVARKGMENNVKLGPGGIREVEFVGQVFQLIRGGREPKLQQRGILGVLDALVELGYLPAFAAQQLTDAYIFLRLVENRLQAFADRQTHELPDDEQQQQRLAWSMGYETWKAFHVALSRHMRTVHNHFEQVFAAPQTEEGEDSGKDLPTKIWRGTADEASAVAHLEQAGFRDSQAVLERVKSLRESSRYRGLSANGRTRMDRLMPLLIGAVAAAQNADETFSRVLTVIESIARRTSYLALLNEHPMALSQLVKLCAASPWVTEFMAQYPLLLDELLDPRSLYAPMQRSALEKEAAELLRAVPPDDLEQEMELLRQFAHTSILRVAAADVASAMPLMIVSDHLTEIAEVVLQHVLNATWGYLTRRHGVPLVQEGNEFRAVGFAIIAYGKLGGIELGYGSDLDIVFLHDSRGEHAFTAGPAKIDNQVFFARLGQRIIHMLTAFTPSGTLYEVDTRLRPSGASGLLVTSVDTFAHYQREEAWTWEHQALVRARLVAGDAGVGAQFSRIRNEVVGRQRDPLKLRQDVAEMREKMRAELGQKDPQVFDLKQDRGGIADIEFLVQYGVLRWAHRYPELLRWTDNIRILETLERVGLMAPAEAADLQEAYRALRREVHRLTLQKQPTRVEAAGFTSWRERVTSLWEELLVRGRWDAA